MNAPDLRNLPPQSIEAEQGLLGAILTAGGNVLDRVEGAVSAADLYRDDHRRIFTAAKALHDAGKAVDVLTVSDALSARGESDQAGGFAYLVDLGNSGFVAANARQYAATIREKSILRGLQRISGDTLDACACPAGRTPAQIAEEAESGMLALLDRSETGPVDVLGCMCEIAQDTIDRHEQGGPTGLLTGFTWLDSVTGGLQPGQFVVVAARPGSGKTMFGCNVASAAATAGETVLFFTMEMPAKQISARILAARSGVPVSVMRAGTGDGEKHNAMSDAIGSAMRAGWKFFVDATPGVSVPYVRAKARRLRRTQGLGLIVIDYIGLMSGPGENRIQQVGAVSRALKALAVELMIPIVVVAQINRDAGNGEEPLLVNLRDSGQIEQDADLVIMLHRPELYKQTPEWNGLAKLLLRKHRDGATGECVLSFDGPRMRFADYNGPCPAPTAVPKTAARKGFDA